MQYPATTELKRAIVYTRISQDSTGEAAGVERQREDCLKYCQERGWQVVAELEDNDIGASKYSKKKRRAYLEALQLIENGRADALVAWHLDRLWRQPCELEHLIELAQRHQVTVATLYGEADLQTGDGQFLARILVSVAAKSSDDSSRRIKRQALQGAMQGKPYGSVRAYGYTDSMNSAIKDDEADILREMARRIISGQSLLDVTYWLNENGHPTSRGNLWITRGVKRTLTHKIYIAIREYEGVDYPGTWQPIFDLETWERLQLAIKARERNAGKVYGRKYLLTGLVVCGVCGKHLVGSTSYNNRMGNLHPVYHCRKKGYYLPTGGCGSIKQGSEVLEHHVVEQVMQRLDSPYLGKILTEQQNNGQLADALNQRQLQRQRLDGLVDDYSTGLLDRTEFARAKHTAEAQLTRIDSEIAALTASTAVKLDVGDTLRSAWDKNPQSWRRALLTLVIKEIRIMPTRKATGYYKVGDKVYRFNPDRLQIYWTDGLTT